MSHILIIGAGMAGLTAAIDLQKQGNRVTVIDKGRGVGGRMVTRRLGNGRADHGAQFFSAKTPDFQSFTKGLLAKKIAAEWWVTDKKGKRYIGKNGMSAIPKAMAADISVRLNERVVRVSYVDGGYALHTEAGNVFTGDKLIITSPAPQTLELLINSDFMVDNAVLAALKAIYYRPCFAVMALLEKPSLIPAPGNLTLTEGPLAWLADNFQKGISPVPTVTLHATQDFSEQNLEKDLLAVKKQLLEAAAEWIPEGSILDSQVQRWRYALADGRNSNPFLMVNTSFLIGGDGFGDGNVEGAFVSGKAMAAELGVYSF